VAQRNDRPAGAIPQTEFGLQVRLPQLEPLATRWLVSAPVFCYAQKSIMSNRTVLSASIAAAQRTVIPVALLFGLCGSSVGQQYFPEAAFDQRKKSNDFVVEWYSQQLKALQEPSLWETSKRPEQQVFRFLWLRSFHHRVVIRLNINDDGTGDLVTKVGGGQGGYPPGKLIENRTQRISKQQTQWFLDEVKEVKYWDLPTREEQHPNEVSVDGAQWVVEAARNGTYKVVDRWSPDKGPIRTLGLSMAIDLAGMKLLYQDVY
jgi:hypothetical protein